MDTTTVLQQAADALKDMDREDGKTKLSKWLNTNFRIEMTDGRVLIGVFLCTDRDANVILGACSEYLKGSEMDSEEPRVLGLVMVPGRHIVSIQIDDTTPPQKYYYDEYAARQQNSIRNIYLVGNISSTSNQSILYESRNGWALWKMGACSEYLKGELESEEPRVISLVMVPGRHIVSIQRHTSPVAPMTDPY